MKIKKKKIGGGGGEGSGDGMVGLRGGGQDGCENRIEVFVKIQKKKKLGGGGGGPGGVRVDVNEELKFCENSKTIFFGGVGGRGSGRVGGVRVDVNEELKFL